MLSSLEIFHYHVFYSCITTEYVNTIYIHVCRCKHADDLEARFVKRASSRRNHGGCLSFLLK